DLAGVDGLLDLVGGGHSPVHHPCDLSLPAFGAHCVLLVFHQAFLLGVLCRREVCGGGALRDCSAEQHPGGGIAVFQGSFCPGNRFTDLSVVVQGSAL